MEPRNIHAPAYILEFKVYSPQKEKSLQDTLTAALTQIREKNYDAILLANAIMVSHLWDFLSLYFKMTYFPLLSHFSVSYNQSNNTFKLIKAPEFVVPLSYGTQFVVLSVSPSRTLS